MFDWLRRRKLLAVTRTDDVIPPFRLRVLLRNEMLVNVDSYSLYVMSKFGPTYMGGWSEILRTVDGLVIEIKYGKEPIIIEHGEPNQ